MAVDRNIPLPLQRRNENHRLAYEGYRFSSDLAAFLFVRGTGVPPVVLTCNRRLPGFS
jgi:hypothetical protein